jgi:hypothetical protein
MCSALNDRDFRSSIAGKKTVMSDKSEREPPRNVLSRAREAMRAHEALEKVRRQQQGHGKPIIATIDGAYRFVAVGSTMHWGKSWRVFPDFLLYFLEKTFSPKWAAREQPQGQHPLFRWLGKTQRYSATVTATGKVKVGSLMGFFACWLHLAYALYLIEHNDQIPKRLMKRLRDPSSFKPAYYEAIVGAALAVAGFELSCAETKSLSVSTPEFRAKSKASETTYEVEAKRKERWKAAAEDPTDPTFQRELESWVRDQIHKSSKKKLTNAIYCFELSIPTNYPEALWRVVGEKVDKVVREAEKTMTVEGEPIGPAIIFITNHTFLANEDVEGAPVVGFLATIKTDDFPLGRAMELEATLAGYDKYRDLFRLGEAWKVAQTVPVTFDGTPPELLSPDGQAEKAVQIGDLLLVPDGQGNEFVGRVEEIASIGGQATVVVRDVATNATHLASFPLTEGEAKAAARFTDAVFGKAEARHQLREETPFDLYDFFLACYGNLTCEQVDHLCDQMPEAQDLKDLPLEEARVRLARGFTKSIWVRAAQKTNPPNAPVSD